MSIEDQRFRFKLNKIFKTPELYRRVSWKNLFLIWKLKRKTPYIYEIFFSELFAYVLLNPVILNKFIGFDNFSIVLFNNGKGYYIGQSLSELLKHIKEKKRLASDNLLKEHYDIEVE